MTDGLVLALVVVNLLLVCAQAYVSHKRPE